MEALDEVAGKDLKNTDIKPNELSKAQKVTLPGTPTHIVNILNCSFEISKLIYLPLCFRFQAFSADQLTLAVSVIIDNAPKLYFYDTRAFAQGQPPAKPFAEVKLMSSF